MAKKAQDTPKEKQLILISDEPAFLNGEYVRQEDAFNHEAVASVLHEMIEDNDPPLTVGLYGGWGVGKSSIINLLKSKFRDQLIIEFNSWRYSGDSFRRQFLIATVDGLLPPGHPEREIELDNIRKLNYAKILEEEAGMTLPDIIRSPWTTEGRKKLWAEIVYDWDNMKPTRGGLIRTIVFAIFGLAGLALWIWGAPQMQSWGVISFLLSVSSFLAPKIDNLFVSKRREVFDAKLIFPEQFESEFERLVNKYRSQKKVIVIIDDLDRCEGQTIRDILVTLKNFLGKKECYFVVPMDDTSVVETIRGSNEANFSYEQLRKYFNVFVRIPAIVETDIFSFAERVAEAYYVSPDVALIGASGHCRDARKIKHFLNLYIVKRALLQERISQKLLQVKEEETLDIERELARLAVLEYQHPKIYAALSMNPAYFGEILQSAMDPNYKSEILDQFIIELGDTHAPNLWRAEPNLQEFLKATSNVHNIHTDMLLTMKASESEYSLGDLGAKINAAIFGSVRENFWADFPDEIITENLRGIVTLLKGRMSIKTRFYLRATGAATLALQLIETKKLPDSTKSRVFGDALNVILVSEARFDFRQYLRTILENVPLVPIHFRDSLARKMEEKYIDVPHYTAEIRAILLHQNLSLLISARPALRDKLLANIVAWQADLEGDLKVQLREDIKELSDRPDTKQILGSEFPQESVIMFAIDELATEKMGDASLVTKANLALLFAKNVPLSKYSKELSRVIAGIIDLEDFSSSLVSVAIEVINRITFPLPDSGKLYTSFMTTLDLKDADADTWNAIIRLYLSLKPEPELIAELVDDMSEIRIPVFSTIFSNQDSSAFSESNPPWNEKRSTLMNQVARRIWEVSSVATPSEATREAALYSSSIPNVVKSEEISALFNNICSGNENAYLQLWRDGLIVLFSRMGSADQKNALEFLCGKISDLTTTLEKREWLFDLLNELTLNQTLELKRLFADKQLQLLVSEDTALRSFAVSHLQDLERHYQREPIVSFVPAIWSKLLEEDALIPFQETLDSTGPYQERVPASVWHHLSQRIREKINIPEGVSVAEKIYMLNAGGNIRQLDENEKNELAFILSDVHRSNLNQDIRAAAYNLEQDLARNGVINPYVQPPVQDTKVEG